MTRNKALARYHGQKNQARLRGIGWELTFQQWLDWWGGDLDRRGSRADNLQMQRIGDTGPYALDNIKKGYPRDNSRTCWAVQASKRTTRLAKQIEAARDADPGSLESPDDLPPGDDESISEYYARMTRLAGWTKIYSPFA